MFCNKCGEQVPDGSKFCNHCGHEIGEQINNREIILSTPAYIDNIYFWREGNYETVSSGLLKENFGSGFVCAMSLKHKDGFWIAANGTWTVVIVSEADSSSWSGWVLNKKDISQIDKIKRKKGVIFCEQVTTDKNSFKWGSWNNRYKSWEELTIKLRRADTMIYAENYGRNQLQIFMWFETESGEILYKNGNPIPWSILSV